MTTNFYSLLEQFNDAAWARVISELEPAIHPVDQRATRIWFAFFPVKLYRAITNSDHPKTTASSLILKGKYLLKDQVDSSARFLYGHRYWPQVKAEVAKYAAAAEGKVESNAASQTETSATLAAQIREVAGKLASALKTDEALIVGITAIAFATLQQVGADEFAKPALVGERDKGSNKGQGKSPEQIIADRAKDDGQGMFGFLKTVDKKFSVIFNEREPDASFKLISGQDVTTAAALDKRDHHTRDERCVPGEGPIPIECRTAACGTCWVGVLSPTEKLNSPTRRELEKWPYFGYEGFTGADDSPIRLACQLKASGNVTIVIPPWCGMIGKLDEKAKAQTS